jgi:hypothetical protein
MGSNRGARLLLAVGFLAALIGYDAWLFSHVVLDPDATRSAAHALIGTPAVRDRIADHLTDELEKQLPAANGDPRVASAVATAVRDPRVATAFSDTVADIRSAVLTDGSGPETFTVDGHALTAALHDALLPVDPRLAAQVERLRPLDVRLESKDLPHTKDPRAALGVVAGLGTTAAALFITSALLLAHDRRTVARVGRRTAFLAVTPLLLFALLPRVLSIPSGDAAQIASALLRVYGNRALPSAIALVVVGIAIVVGSIVWPKFDLTRATRRAAATRSAPTSWPRSRAQYRANGVKGPVDATAREQKTYL